ncbi:oxygenase MpaB family protein [Pilimelia terevasa]|nr:oxygenase MpaB family protein [Pilimelia terevasa]
MTTAQPADAGLFGPGSVTWRVHDEPVLLLGGLRSLFLQALHPRAIAAVAQNSRYREDPWGRLQRTSTYLVTAIYGTSAEAAAAGARIRRLHARMSATDPRTGERFAVDDPHLLRWVHVAEVESFLTTARRAGLRLTDAEADRYYDEQRRGAALVGLDPATVPGSAAQVRDYYRAMRPELALTRDAAEALCYLFAPPMPWWLTLSPARPAYAGVAAAAFASMPGWARRRYGALGLPVADAAATATAQALRTLLRTLPRRWWESPVHRAARERLATPA